MFAAPTADVQAEFAAQRVKAALERPKHARRNAGGMPIHPHQRAKRLKPEGMRHAAKKLVAPVVVNDGLGQDRAKPGHAVCKPFRHMTIMERQIGATRSSHRHASRLDLSSYFVLNRP